MIPAILALLSAGRAAAAAEGVAAAVTAGARAGVSSYSSNKVMELLTTRRDKASPEAANDSSANDNATSPENRKKAASGGSGRGGGDDGSKPPFVPVDRSSIVTNRLFSANDNNTNEDSVTIGALLPVVKSIDRNTMQMVLQMDDLNDKLDHMFGIMMVSDGFANFNSAESRIESGSKESKEDYNKKMQLEKEKKQIKNGATGLLAGGLAFGLGSIIAGGDPKVTVDTPGGGYAAPPPTKKPDPPKEKPKRKPSMIDGMLNWLGYDTSNTDTNQSSFLPEPTGKGKGKSGPIPGKYTGRERELLKVISENEGAGYDTVFGYGKYAKPEKKLTDMTINEVFAFQTKLRDATAGKIGKGAGVGTTAVGRGQFIKPTLKANLEAMGYKESDYDKLKYTPELQDALTLNNAKMSGIDPNRPETLKNQRRLGGQWESLDEAHMSAERFAKIAKRVEAASTKVQIIPGAKPSDQAKKPMPKPTQKQEDGVLDYISKGVSDIVKSATNYMSAKKGSELKKQSDMQSAKDSKKSVTVVDASTTNNNNSSGKSSDKLAKRPTPKAKQQTTFESWSKYFGL